jgi:cephalosporin-C deacetylase-like acetyl esterase
LFKKNLALRAAAISRDQFKGIDSLAAWKARRPEIKRQFLEMLGLDPLPPRTPLNARITGKFARDGYRVENIVFESQPRLYVTGNLYLPQSAGQGARVPPIVYVTGHSPDPAGAKFSYQHHGVWFARHGFAAFVLDTIEFAEIPGIHHGTHNLEMWHWLSLGYNPTAVEVWNAMRALDYLESRPEIDRARAGITGRSGGGAVSWFTAAADERFQVASPVHGTWSIGPHVADDVVRQNCDCIYFWNTYQVDLPVVGALIAPRPLNIVNAVKDGAFPPSGYRPVFEGLRPVYEWYGATEKLAQYEDNTGHEDTPAYRKSANEWLNRWLRQDTTPYVEEAIPKEDASLLRVLDGYVPGARNEGIDRTFIASHKPRPFKTRAEWERRKEQLLAALKAKSYRIFPGTRVPFETVKAKTNMWTTRYADAWRVEFATEESLRVNGQLFVPRDGRRRHPALIYVKGKDDLVFGVDYDNLLSAFAHHVVLVLNPRAVDYPMDNFRVAATKMTAALLGGTLETMQLWDLMQSINWLAEEKIELEGISVYGRKHMGALALHAAALDPRITRVILDNAPGSHWEGPAVLNVLRLSDLPEVAGMMAPREIVSLTPPSAAFRYTSSIYSLYGGAGIREAASLADALRVWEAGTQNATERE